MTDLTKLTELTAPETSTETVAPLGFEASIEALEAMVDQLESDELPLEQAMQAFERSQALIRNCQQQLSQAEERVQVLVRQLEADGFSYDTEDFEDDDDDDDDEP